MSNHDNHRRGESKRTEHGPTWEGSPSASGCNSTHVAKARADWKKIKNRSERRTGRRTPKFHAIKPGRPNERPAVEIDDEDVP